MMAKGKIDHDERFATTTSYHGVAHIYDSNNSKKTKSIWIILVILATAICISQCVIIIYNASLLPTRMVIRKRLMNSSVFPSVTICNTNDFDYTGLPANDLNHLSSIVNAIYGYTPASAADDAIQYFVQKHGDDFQINNYTRMAGHKLKNMLLSCTWMGEPCTVNDFTNIISNGGSCFTFNPGTNAIPLKNQTVSGNINGLRLILNVEQYKYYSPLFSPQAPDAGIRFTINYYKQPPNFISKPYYAPTGFHTYVPITLHRDKRLTKPWGECGELLLKDHSYYSRDACLTEYASELAALTCNCSSSGQTATNSCNGAKFLTCIIPSSFVIRMSLSQNLSVCPIACETYSYPTEISQSSLGTFAFSRVLDPVINISTILGKAKDEHWIPPSLPYSVSEFIRDNIVYLDIYYSDLRVTETEQQEDTGFSKVLSEIGGQLGLCIGASVITLCEIIQYLIGKFFTSEKKTNLNKRQNTTSPLFYNRNSPDADATNPDM
uniref:Acid-sensing ion channel 6 n=1 Tax=Trichoplax adhaerens TaxID=10228 RepID=A0A5J6BVG3_TRIAD|nr:acid-sensing ion channel 6 [Trichoplax adhaerens]